MTSLGFRSLLFRPQLPITPAVRCVFLEVLDIAVISQPYKDLHPDLAATIFALVWNCTGSVEHFLASARAAWRLFPTHPSWGRGTVLV